MKTHRLLTDHDGGDIPDYHEWLCLGDTEYCDADGRQHQGHQIWLVLQCNNPGCPARLIVSERAFVEWATKAVA